MKQPFPFSNRLVRLCQFKCKLHQKYAHETFKVFKIMNFIKLHDFSKTFNEFLLNFITFPGMENGILKTLWICGGTSRCLRRPHLSLTHSWERQWNGQQQAATYVTGRLRFQVTEVTSAFCPHRGEPKSYWCDDMYNSFCFTRNLLTEGVLWWTDWKRQACQSQKMKDKTDGWKHRSARAKSFKTKQTAGNADLPKASQLLQTDKEDLVPFKKKHTLWRCGVRTLIHGLWLLQQTALVLFTL